MAWVKFSSSVSIGSPDIGLVLLRSAGQIPILRESGPQLRQQSHRFGQRRAPMAPDTASQQGILVSHLDRLLSSREYPKTICPSEVPRALSAAELRTIGVADWRDLMPEVREMLQDRRRRGQVEILQKGLLVPDDVNMCDLKGPIRARKVEEWTATKAVV